MVPFHHNIFLIIKLFKFVRRVALLFVSGMVNCISYVDKLKLETFVTVINCWVLCNNSENYNNFKLFVDGSEFLIRLFFSY